MKILIVGGTSSLGKAITKPLSIDHDVITAGRSNCDIIFDLNDPIDKLHFPENLDTVIIVAAHFGGKSKEDIYDAERTNVLGTLKICQAAKNNNCKHVILISSIFTLLPKETDNYSIYSLSKKHSEEVAELFCSTHELPLTILRPSQLYGNIDNLHIRQPFLNLLLNRADKGEDITIFGTHDAKINLLHIDDLVNVIILVIEKKILGTYSCTNLNDTTYSESAKIAFQMSNQKEKIFFDSNEKNISDNVFDNDETLYEKINFYPQVTLQEVIKNVYKFRKSIA